MLALEGHPFYLVKAVFRQIIHMARWVYGLPWDNFALYGALGVLLSALFYALILVSQLVSMLIVSATSPGLFRIIGFVLFRVFLIFMAIVFVVRFVDYFRESNDESEK